MRGKSPGSRMDFRAQLEAYRTRVERGLDSLLPPATTRPSRLHEAMRYSLQAGGKRLRPVLLLAASDLFGPPDLKSQISDSRPAGPKHADAGLKSEISNLKFTAPAAERADALSAAVAVECLHTYSLVHDDLPCMDDDDLRRGRPTAHKQFDEATALLAGDALLTFAFQLLARHYPGSLAHALVGDLAEAAGSEHLIGGQMEDLLAEKKAGASADDLRFIHLNKTAAILTAALVMGGRCGGADKSGLATLRRAGRHLGLAFQIVDDVLDATADTKTLGKTAGKDARADKTTWVKLHGLPAAREHAAQETEAALAALRSLPGGAPFLVQLAGEMLRRAS